MKDLREETKELILTPEMGSLSDSMKELWEYRELIKMFVMRNFKTMYAQTFLGPVWYLLNALMSTTVLTIVFGEIANISTAGVPQFLFYMSGNILWSFFSGCLSSVSDTFLSNSHLMGKVYFPRLSVPIATTFSKQIQFFIQFSLFIVFYVMYMTKSQAAISIGGVILLPVLLIELSLLGMACGMIVAAVTVKYRDLRVLVSFGLQLWMYATPIVYPLSTIPGVWRKLMILNPVASIVESFRGVFFASISIPYKELGVSMAVTCGILFVGIILFQKTQRTFADTI